MDIGKYNYFYVRKLRNGPEYQLLTRIYDYCVGDTELLSELLRRLRLLNLDDRNELQLQGGNFVSELTAFEKFVNEGYLPRWVPESQKKGVKSPDFYVTTVDSKFPIEVKTLNLPQEEGNLLRSANGSPVNEMQVTPSEPSFDAKIRSNCFDAVEKFRHFLELPDTNPNISGLIWFSYIPSQMTRMEKGATQRMVEYIKALANKITPKDVKIFVENAWPDVE